MGVDLALMPDTFGSFQHRWKTMLATERIELGRVYDIHHAIQNVERPLPPPLEAVDVYGDEGIERRTTNPYGSPITYASAGALVACIGEDPPNWRARAALGYLRELPPLHPVVLWWH